MIGLAKFFLLKHKNLARHCDFIVLVVANWTAGFVLVVENNADCSLAYAGLTLKSISLTPQSEIVKQSIGFPACTPNPGGCLLEPVVNR